MEKECPHIRNSFTNRVSTFFNAFLTTFRTKKKVDFMNKENIDNIRKENKDLTILLHGTSANYHRSMYRTIKLLRKYGVDVISVGYDYKKSIEDSSIYIKEQIDDLMKKTSKNKINIIGISLGGLVARYYAEKLRGRKSINKLVTIFSPLEPIPPHEFGAKVTKLFGGKINLYNIALKELKNTHPVKNHLYIYGTRDKIIKPKYSVHRSANHISFEGGHLLVSYNPKVLEIAAKYIKGKEILEDKL